MRIYRRHLISTITISLGCMTALESAACGRIGFDDIDVDAAPSGRIQSVGPVDGSSEEEGPSEVDGSSEAAPCATRTVLDFCSNIRALAAPPVIDGDLDCGPALAWIAPSGWSGAGVKPDGGMTVPEGNSASVAAAWRPDGLYVFVAVTDPDRVPAELGSAPFLGDAVELYVDNDGMFANPPAFDDPGSSQMVVSAPGDAATPSTRGEIYRDQADEGASTASRMGAFPTPTGYAVEAFVVAADLGLSDWRLTAGQQIGFDIAVDVSYPTAAASETRDYGFGQYFLHIGPSPDLLPYQDVRSFCTPTLVP